jgi:hypothetical protein
VRGCVISASIGTDMTTDEGNPPVSAGALASGALLAGWLLACDAWVKLLARSAACADVGTVGDAAGRIWAVPQGCTPLDIGLGVAVVPMTRTGATPLDIALPAGLGPVWGLALLGVATVVSILFLRWRWRIAGDAMALGTFWAGALLHGLPRMLLGGTTITELQIGAWGIGIGDLALAWGGVWLGWRAVAELRA